MARHTSFCEACRQSSKHFCSTDISVKPQGGERTLKNKAAEAQWEKLSFTQCRFIDWSSNSCYCFYKSIFVYLCKSVKSDVDWAQGVKFRLSHLKDRCIMGCLAMQCNCFTIIGHNCSTINNTWHFAWLSNYVNHSGPDASPQFANLLEPPQWLNVGTMTGKTLLISVIEDQTPVYDSLHWKWA